MYFKKISFVVLLLCILVLCIITPQAYCAKSKSVRLALTGSWGANPNVNSFAQMAFFGAWWVNNQSTILPDVDIELDIKNCGVTNSGNPSKCLVESIYAIQQFNYTGFLTGAFTTEQRVIQYAANAFNLPHVSGANTGNVMSNKAEYPTFVRTAPHDEQMDKIIVDLMVKFGWKYAAMALEDADWGAGNYDIISKYAETKGVVIESFVCTTGGSDFSAQAERIKAKGYNIIISMLAIRESYVFLDAANKTGLVGPDYVWILPVTAIQTIITPGVLPAIGRLIPSTMNITALRGLYDGALGLMPKGGVGPLYDHLLPVWNAETTRFPAPRPTITYTWMMFDAVLTYAYALDKMIRGGTPLESITGPNLTKEIRGIDFNGTTGNVFFNANGDRTGLYDLFTLTPTDINIAQIYDPVTKAFTVFSPFLFFGGRTDTPVDSLSICLCVNGECINRVCVCNSGWTGPNCDVEIGDNATTIIAVVIPIGVILTAVMIAGYIFYRRKHNKLVKNIAERQQSDIPRSDIKLATRIGHGAAGEVFTASFRGTEVAVKRIISAGVLSQSAIQEFKLESAIMCSLRHPNIVLFMGSCYDTKTQEMLLVMEYMRKGTLHGVLHQKATRIPLSLQLHLAYQAAQGINFLHQCSPPIIHCDIKSHNVLLDDKWCARISDFGITKLAKMSKQPDMMDEVKRSVGTIFWAAPEVLNGATHTMKSDCYSFGVVLWEIFHREDPFGFADPLHVAVQVSKNGARPAIDPTVPQKISNLIQKCWAQDPAARPTLEDVTNQLREIMIEQDAHGEDGATASSFAGGAAMGAPTGNVFFAATEVQNSDGIWTEFPNEMLIAIKTHNAIIRQQIQRFHGHEVEFNDDKFLITFAKANDVINWALAVQQQLLESDNWPAVFDNYPDTALQRDNNGTLLWSGLRVRIAVHKGQPICKRKQYSDDVTYEGPVKDRAGQLLNYVKGGCIILSEVVANAVDLTTKYIEEISVVPYHATVHSKETQKKEPTFLLQQKLLSERYKISTPPPSSNHPHMIVDVGGADEESSIDDSSSSALLSSPRAEWNVPYSELGIREKIGKSHINEVIKGTLKGSEVAVKLFFNQKFSEDILLDFKSVVATASKFRHPNIVRYLGMTVAPSTNETVGIQIGLIQEYMSNGSLQAYMAKNTLTLADKVKFGYQIANGMRYLAKTNDRKFSSHSNLKSCNILVGKNGDVKVSDYALSGFYDIMRTLTSVESVAWTAPEILEGKDVTPAATVYSFGVLLWEIYMQQAPYGKIHPIKLVTQILEGTRPPIPNDCPKILKTIMEHCWHVNPDDRPTWDEICEDLKQSIN